MTDPAPELRRLQAQVGRLIEENGDLPLTDGPASRNPMRWRRGIRGDR
jgi:hypothetical protein